MASAASLPSVTLFGSTGHVGHYLLEALLRIDGIGAVHTIARRAPRTEDDPQKKLDPTVETDTAKWADQLQAKVSAASSSSSYPCVVSSVGTTRAAAGGIANQWKIDHDLNVDLAKAAKAAGARAFVFVSSGGTRGVLSRSWPYSRMKNGVEDTIRDLDFDQAIIVKPGVILGTREKGHEQTTGGIFAAAVSGLGYLSKGLQDALGQDADMIGRATAHATLLAAQGKAPAKYWVLNPADIVRLGHDEWKF